MKKLKKLSLIDFENNKMKLLNFVVTSDSDDSYLEDKTKPLAKKLKWLYIILIFVVVLTSFFPLFLPPNDQSKWTKSSLNISLNIIIFIVLLSDYLLRWFTYPVRVGKVSKHPFIFFPLTGISILMVISLLPTTFAVFAKFVDDHNPFIKLINVFSIVKIIRLLLLLNFIPTFKIFSSIFQKNRVLLINVFIFMFVMAIIFALMIYSVEGGTKLVTPDEYKSIYGSQPDSSLINSDGLVSVPINKGITNFGDALYFTFITITTIGYGDISPVTTIGRVVVILDAILGILIFSLPSSIIAGSFLVEIQKMYKSIKKNNQETLSFAERMYINSHKYAKKTLQVVTHTETKGEKTENNVEPISKERKISIDGLLINTDSEIYNKIIELLKPKNIKSKTYNSEDNALEIEVNDIDVVDPKFYDFMNIFEMDYTIDEMHK